MIQVLQTEDEVQEEQFKGQTKHNPIDKYLPTSHV